LSLIVWFASMLAHASGSVVWLGEANDAGVAIGMTEVPAAVVAPKADWSVRDDAAINRLRDEVDAVRQLVDEFDGELEIMARLEAAIGDIAVLRDDADRKLLYRALALQGFAVKRYFQDSLPADPTAVPYRVRVGGSTEVEAWVDAVALDPDHIPTRDDVGETPERLALDETRARMLVSPKGTIDLANLPIGATVMVDGQERTPTGSILRVPPGMHRITVEVDDVIRARARIRLDTGDEYLLLVPPTQNQLMQLGTLLRRDQPEVHRLELDVAGSLARLAPPVLLAIPDGNDTVVYRVDGSRALLVEGTHRGALPTAAAAASGSAVLDRPGHVDIWTGAAYIHDPNYYDLNASRGAPAAYGTSNAGAIAPGLTAMYPLGDLPHLGGGIDVMVPTGEWHSLPVGERVMRVRTHTYFAAGLEFAQLTVGALLPWHASLGARARLPLTGRATLDLGAMYAPGITRPRDGNDPDFQPRAVQALLIAIGGEIGP
jgi:hypothetical protein